MAIDTCVRESLRHKLTRLGIPREAQHVDMLARMLPAPLNGTARDEIDADGLAEALIYLIENGIIRRPRRLDELLEIDWGTHACQFYRTEADLLEFLSAYFQHGLAHGEYCVWVAPDAASGEALRARVIEREADRDARQRGFECFTHAGWYLDGAGQMKAADTVLASWAGKTEQALRAGFEGVRCAGQVRRIDRKNWRAIAEYECEVNAALSGLRIKAVCAYPLLECGTRELTDVRNSHQDVLVKGDDWWHRVSAADEREANAVLTALQGGRR